MNVIGYMLNIDYNGREAQYKINNNLIYYIPFKSTNAMVYSRSKNISCRTKNGVIYFAASVMTCFIKGSYLNNIDYPKRIQNIIRRMLR